MEKPHNPVAGVLWMLLTGVNFVGVTAVVKHVGSDVPAAQAAFLRYVLGLVFLIPMVPALMRTRLDGKALTLFAGRGVVHTFGVMLWFFAMARIPIAEVTAMNYLSPVYVTLGAALFLGERLAARRILAVVAAFLGALIILRPGMREVSSGHIAMLGTALMFAASYLIAKRTVALASPTVIVAMLSITVTIGLAPFAIAVWVPPTTEQLAWLFLVSAFATAGHYCMTRAFQAAPLSVTQPVGFLQLVWAALLGLLLFEESIDLWVVIGGGLILGSVSFITWREAQLKRRAVTPLADEAKGL